MLAFVVRLAPNAEHVCELLQTSCSRDLYSCDACLLPAPGDDRFRQPGQRRRATATTGCPKQREGPACGDQAFGSSTSRGAGALGIEKEGPRRRRSTTQSEHDQI